MARLARPGCAQLPGVGKDQRAESRPPPSPTETGIHGPRGRNPQPHSGCPGRRKARVGQGWSAKAGTRERGNMATASTWAGGALGWPRLWPFPLCAPLRPPRGDSGVTLTFQGRHSPDPHQALCPSRPRPGGLQGPWGREGSGGPPWWGSCWVTRAWHTQMCSHTRRLALWQEGSLACPGYSPRSFRRGSVPCWPEWG